MVATSKTKKSVKVSSSLSVEDRLRKLLNSDTESLDGSSKFREMRSPPKYEHRPRSSKLGNAYGENAPGPTPQTRRCKSAVPASFHDKDWNKVPDPKRETMIPSNCTPSKDYSGTFVYLSRSPEKSTVINSTTAVGQTHWNREKSHTKPIPTIRKSLDLDKEEPAFTMQLSQSPAGSNNLRLSAPPNYHHKESTSPQKKHPTSFANRDQVPRITVRPVADHPSSINELQNMYKNTTYLPHQDDLNTYRVSSSPRNTVNDNCDVQRPASPEKRHRRDINSDLNDSNMTHSVASNPEKLFIPQHLRRSDSPRKNSSFRKAIHQNSMTEADRSSGVHSQLSKRTDSMCSSSNPSSLDHSTRKSDDRDSGAVLEPERYSHDFSSDCEEIKPSEFNEKPDELSRSSTPILPPLDEFDEDYNTGEEDTQDDMKPVLEVKPVARHQQQPPHNTGLIDDFKPLPVKDIPPTHRYSTPGNHTNPVITRGNVKVLSSKLQRSQSISSIKSNSRKDPGQKRLKQKSQSQGADVGYGKQRHLNTRKRDGQIAYNDSQEFGDTSSVRSFTTNSVCSSVMRKHGSRRNKYRKGGSGYVVGGEKYIREIRSVNKRFTRLESHVITLARSLAELSTDLRQQTVSTREIEKLKQEVQELKSNQSALQASINQKKSSKHSIKSKSSKISRLFGEQPALHLFLKRLGYEKYIKHFQNEGIGMVELSYMDEKRLSEIGIPLGPRLRILRESQNPNSSLV